MSTRPKKRIYLDHAAITPVDNKVEREMAKWNVPRYGNPSSIHMEGYLARRGLEDARKRVADFFHGQPDEITFTGSGTEANNLAIFGAFERELEKGKKAVELHFLTSAIEHASVMECARTLERDGVKVDYTAVNPDGIVNISDLRRKIRPETFLVSIMYANNEIGTIEPVPQIARLIRRGRKIQKVSLPTLRSNSPLPLFHVDACQAPLFLPLDVRKLGADLIAIDGQKVYGPRGIGALWKRRGIKICPQIVGGGQENGLRSGTENIAACRGLALALEIAETRRKSDNERLCALCDYFITELLRLSPNIILNGDRRHRLPNNINISVLGTDNEFIVINLDAAGIACSTKSSCLRDEAESYVVYALASDQKRARTSVRFSLGRETTKGDIDCVLLTLKRLLSR